MKWLVDCSHIAVPPQPDLPALHPPKPLSKRVPVEDNGEPLVSLEGAIKLYRVYSWLGFKHMPTVPRLRTSVLERLQRASARLPPDFELVIIDGHRTRAFQEELLAYYQAQTTQALDEFVSDPASTTVVPPHTTGGAVDLTLGWRGAVLGLGTDFDCFVTESAPAALEENDVDGPARDLRRLLASVLSREGMTVIESEWWHWSYGDQHWAAATGAPAAVYNAAI
jgi:D-alanyl-D-alanine dipeptidase